MSCQTTKEALRRRMVSLERWDAPRLSLPRLEVHDFFAANDGQRLLDLANCTCGVFRGCVSRHSPFDEAVIRRIRDPGNPYIVVLGFLCHVDLTGLIHRFFEGGYSDEWLHTKELSREQLDHLFGSPESGGKADSHIEFDIQLFFMPIIRDAAKQQYFSPMRTLPYTVEEKIGGGGYGNVYRVKILDGGYFAFLDEADVGSPPPILPHRDRADRRQDRLVAIKHYTCTSAYDAKADWEKEWKNNLMYEHPHIVPILASIAQGEVYMNFYPLCEHDLHAWLTRDPPKHDPESVWRQFMGLLSALRHVHSGHSDKYGYHFDIKCQNILVRKGKWMIADLGIAHNKSTDGTSTTGRRPGPEEFGGPETRVTRKFDIWGIACVGCIVFAWLLGGAGSVAQFREDRKVEISEPHGAVSILYNFFQMGPDGAVVHSAVEELFSKADDPISKGVAAILRDMLSIDVNMRPTAEEAEKRFGEVLAVEPLALQLPRGAGSVSTRQTRHVPRPPLTSCEQRSTPAQLSVPVGGVSAPLRPQHCRLPITTLLS